MATIVEVAALAGVSTSTVSHVLNDTRRVEPATRRKVLQAIEQTSYRQDALARAMRRSKTDSIGLIVSDTGEPAFADMVHGVEMVAARRDLTLLLSNSAEDGTRELKAVQVLLERRVDGLVLARAAASKPEVMELLEKAKPPVVLLDRMTKDAPFDQVGAENREPMRSLIGHLITAGHRRFIVAAGDTRVSTLRDRADGFMTAVLESGLSLDDQEIIETSSSTALRKQLTKALEEPTRATAVIAGSTVLAAQALSVFRDIGIRTPGDIAFATFDGFSHSDLFEPSITTVRQPAVEVGSAAVDLLHERLSGSTSSPKIVHLQQSIEYRDSTENYRFTG